MTSPNTLAGTPRDEDRETLSALFDGELDPHGRLFATRRLSHDADWQADCGRWQLIGDSMRRQAPIAAPVTFAAQVAQAVALERVQETAKVRPNRVVEPRAVQASMSARRDLRARWVSGALAASVALAAVLIARPFAADSPRASGDVALAAAASVAPASAVVASPDSASSPAAALIATDSDVAVSSVSPPESRAGSVATAAVPQTSRDSRALSDPARSRVGVRAPARTSAVPGVDETAPIVLASAANPFALPSADAIPARPWPRAVLGGQGEPAFAAGYRRDDESPRSAPSFYPFQPATRIDPSAENRAP